MGKLKIGYIAKAHGIKGEVQLRLFDKDDSFVIKGLEVFLRDKPYKITNFRRPKEGLLLKLEGVETRNESELLKGCEVLVETSVFQSESEDEIYLNQLIGYEVHLGEEPKGRISGFAETAAHDLLRVELFSGEEVEIPYVDEFISKVDKLKKILKVDCPEELFDADFLSGSKK